MVDWWTRYSVLQSDGNSFSVDIVWDCIIMKYMDEVRTNKHLFSKFQMLKVIEENENIKKYFTLQRGVHKIEV